MGLSKDGLENGIENHTSYFNEGSTSLDNIGHIVAGDTGGGEVTTEAGRTQTGEEVVKEAVAREIVQRVDETRQVIVDTGEAVVDTGHAVIEGVIDTGQAVVGGVIDTGEAVVGGVIDTGEAVVTGVNDGVTWVGDQLEDIGPLIRPRPLIDFGSLWH